MGALPSQSRERRRCDAVVRHEEINGKIVRGVDAVMVELGDPVLGEERVVDQEAAGELARRRCHENGIWPRTIWKSQFELRPR